MVNTIPESLHSRQTFGVGTVQREIFIEVDPDEVWAIVGDFADGPTRMAPGFVTDSAMDGQDVRVVTFADGTVVHERFVGLDNAARRLAFSIVGGTATPVHDNASMQAFAEGTGTRFVWIHDTLPDELADRYGPAMTHGLAVFKKSMENRATS